MKNMLKIGFAFLLAGVLVSCKKNVSTISFEGGTPPVLTANRSGSIPLDFATKDEEAVKLSWTNPDYRFSTGLSSHDVAYKIEIDTTGANFTNPGKKVIGLSRDLTLSMTQSELNGYLLNDLNLVDSIPHSIDIKVTSNLANNSGLLTSNVMQFTVVPYGIPPAVEPPASGKLFITGNATPGNWMADNDPEIASQQFTQVTPTLYVINSIQLTGGNSYLFVPVYGNWTNKYGFTGDGEQNNVISDDFKAGGNNMKAPPESGAYKVEVDFQRGKFTVTKL